ncbi:nuclear transport factor 2 family protein [Granulicella arctica]|uniref:Ketosteroid isomerase-like protein n=1 Tax=Granulicella arctica TaxID=940613 RepID=A0A7Y9TTZ6_9BACT|nr:nuclear transport factor 2 family protein [Granulicella arctica]NYF80443.1 ketosteroid isomerase-like protein [Granulicella arctica]
MKSIFALRKMLWLSLLLAPTGLAYSQTPTVKTAPDPLYQTIASLDASLFDAYNQCDLDKLGTLVTDDLEFYHDKTGLAVGKATFLDSIHKYICGKVTRELVPGTLEVYPLHDYGAVEIGIHRFHHPGKDQTEPLGEAKFVMLWQNKGGVWKISRVISYDHVALTK